MLWCYGFSLLRKFLKPISISVLPSCGLVAMSVCLCIFCDRGRLLLWLVREQPYRDGWETGRNAYGPSDAMMASRVEADSDSELCVMWCDEGRLTTSVWVELVIAGCWSGCLKVVGGGGGGGGGEGWMKGAGLCLVCRSRWVCPMWLHWAI